MYIQFICYLNFQKLKKDLENLFSNCHKVNFRKKHILAIFCIIFQKIDIISDVIIAIAAKFIVIAANGFLLPGAWSDKNTPGQIGLKAVALTKYFAFVLIKYFKCYLNFLILQTCLAGKNDMKVL